MVQQVQVQRQEEPGRAKRGVLVARGCTRGAARGSAAPPAWHGQSSLDTGARTRPHAAGVQDGRAAGTHGAGLWDTAVCSVPLPSATGQGFTTGRVCTAANLWDREGRRDRDVTALG